MNMNDMESLLDHSVKFVTNHTYVSKVVIIANRNDGYAQINITDNDDKEMSFRYHPRYE